jgi:hypothetical protein
VSSASGVAKSTSHDEVWCEICNMRVHKKKQFWRVYNDGAAHLTCIIRESGVLARLGEFAEASTATRDTRIAA